MENDLSYIAADLRPLAHSIAELHEHSHNARYHSEANLQAIAASYKAFGQRKPIVCRRDGNVSIAGSGQLRAARDILGWSHIAVVWTDDDEQTATAFAIADNQTGALASWNNETLLSQLAELRDGAALDGVGFTEDEVKAMIDATRSDPANDETNDIPTIYQILIECQDELSQSDLLMRLTDEGIKCRSLIS